MLKKEVHVNTDGLVVNTSVFHSRTVCALLKRDPTIINDEDDASNTPLHLAALYGHYRVVKELLESGAAIDARLELSLLLLLLLLLLSLYMPL